MSARACVRACVRAVIVDICIITKKGDVGKFVYICVSEICAIFKRIIYVFRNKKYNMNTPDYIVQNTGQRFYV